jgi:hypothetical protein
LFAWQTGASNARLLLYAVQVLGLARNRVMIVLTQQRKSRAYAVGRALEISAGEPIFAKRFD